MLPTYLSQLVSRKLVAFVVASLSSKVCGKLMVALKLMREWHFYIFHQHHLAFGLLTNNSGSRLLTGSEKNHSLPAIVSVGFIL